MLLFYGLKFQVCYFCFTQKNPQMSVPLQKFFRVPPSHPGFQSGQTDICSGRFLSGVLSKVICVDLGLGYTDTFSNRSTLDCIFKYLRFHDRIHRLLVDRR